MGLHRSIAACRSRATRLIYGCHQFGLAAVARGSGSCRHIQRRALDRSQGSRWRQWRCSCGFHKQVNQARINRTAITPSITRPAMFSFVRDLSITKEISCATKAPAHAALSASAASLLPMRKTAVPAPMKSPPYGSPTWRRAEALCRRGYGRRPAGSDTRMDDVASGVVA